LGRPIDPDAQYRIKPHITKGYTYASTQPPLVDPETGKKTYRYIHWGTVDENLKFTPNSLFILASPEERKKLIFPTNWDMSMVEKCTEFANSEIPVINMDYQNRLYGDIWLLEQVAVKTGVRQDLLAVFTENREIVDDILTLAMFPYLTKYTYNRLARWQRIVEAPSSRTLTSTEITRLTQHITERHRMDFLKMRAARIGMDELCAVDSTTRSAYGDSLVDIRWGNNKDHLPLPQTSEVVVYTLTSHKPIYYRTFPGNMPDVRSVDIILVDLERAGFQNLILITDRGYDSRHILEKYILRGQSVIMCAKTGQELVLKKIQEFGEFNDHPEGMKIDPVSKVYYKQYDIDYEVKAPDANMKKSDRLKLNLYFDPIRRSYERLNLNIALAQQEELLYELLNNNRVLEDVHAIKRNFCYYEVTCDPDTKVIQSFQRKDKKIAKAIQLSGFFANMTHRLDYDAVTALSTYRLRDEQEKYFQQMKDQMVSDRQRNWSEEGKTGRLFILFVALILSSYVRHIWKTSKLKDMFSSSLDVLDEMKPIRCIKATGTSEKKMTPFIGKQLDICEVFGFEIPEGCIPYSNSAQLTPKRKRGRPPKKKANQDSQDL
jgi:hypothetical protein